ncbi:MAG: POTRA domain-containing protein [Chitinophagaceae bacterium]
MHYWGKKYYLVTVIGIFVHCSLYAQLGIVESRAVFPLRLNKDSLSHRDSLPPRSLFIISGITINGDKKTKPYIIERELPFKTGDSIALNVLVDKFDQARRQLINTRLFNDVVVSLKSFKGYLVEVQIDVKERWYLFPIPYFKLADRNLSEWAKQGYDLQRANYGAKLSYYNFTGRNDKLKAWFITGYTRQLQFSYDQPNADKSLKHGYGVYLSYATAKEINHNTINNEQKFIPASKAFDPADSGLFRGQVLNEQFIVSASYTYRPAIRTKHSFRISYNTNRIDAAVAILNPKYFNNGKRFISYPELSYTIDYNNIDYVAYPLKGFIGDAGVIRKGINADMNLWQINAKGTRGWEIANQTFYGLQAYGVLKLPFDQPYYNQRLYGYGDLYLRGLEKYVVDGVAALMVRNTFRRKILNFSIPFSFSKSHDKIPFRVYAKAYGDMGYSYNKNFPQNSLVNKMLYTAGAGIDFVTLYDVVVRFEYSFNQLGQNGLFLHFKNDF